MASSIQIMDWDEDAQRVAMREARELQRRDPEAAALIIATLAATQEEREKSGEIVSRRPDYYNPARLYDIVCKEYGWRPKDIDQMHYMTFFAMVREMSERHERENAELNSIS